jgi:hypothetical protein
MRFLLFLTVLNLFGCNEKDYYKLSKIKDLNIDSNESKIKLSYRLPLDTLYYSPGILIHKYEGKSLIHIVKCSIKEKCKVDIASASKEGMTKVIIPKSDKEECSLSDGKKTKALE